MVIFDFFSCPFHYFLMFIVILTHLYPMPSFLESFCVIFSHFVISFKMTQSHVSSFLSILKVEQLILKYHINFRTHIWSFQCHFRSFFVIFPPWWHFVIFGQFWLFQFLFIFFSNFYSQFHSFMSFSIIFRVILCHFQSFCHFSSKWLKVMFLHFLAF